MLVITNRKGAVDEFDSALFHFLVAVEGFEPPTHGL